MTDTGVVAGPVDLNGVFRELFVGVLQLVGLFLLAVVAVIVVAGVLLAAVLALLRLARGPARNVATRADPFPTRERSVRIRR